MPITQCPKHGETGTVEMCEHLAKKLNRGIYQPFFEVPVQTTRLCIKCFDKYKIKDLLKSIDIPKEDIKEFRKKLKRTDEIEQNRDWYDAVLKHPSEKPLERVRFIYRDLMKTRGWKCVDCIDKIYIKYARKNNLDLPFEPFENTLFTDTYNDKNVLALEKRLKKILNPEIVLDVRHYQNYRIYSGSYRSLLTIEIFGAESEHEQQAVLKTIEDFYTKRKKKQRKVIFHTKWVMIYNEEEKRDGLEADVLLEVVVK